MHGKPDINIEDFIDKRLLRFMGDGAAFNFIAMQQAIEDSGLEEKEVSNERTGLIVGSGGPSTKNLFAAHKTVIEKGSPKGWDHLWLLGECHLQTQLVLRLLLK